jgi:hypothetical protein
MTPGGGRLTISVQIIPTEMRQKLMLQEYIGDKQDWKSDNL